MLQSLWRGLVNAFYRDHIEPFCAMGVTPMLVDHQGKTQAGEKQKDKSPIGGVYKTNNARSVLQFMLDEYDKETSTLDIRVRTFKTNNEPVEPFGIRVRFSAGEVSVSTRELPAEETMDEERTPVAARILAALKLEDQTVDDLVRLTGAAQGTIYNKLGELIAAGKAQEKGYRGRKKLYGSCSGPGPEHPEKGPDFVTREGGKTDENDGSLFSSSSNTPREGGDDENKNGQQPDTSQNKPIQPEGTVLQEKPESVEAFFANPPAWAVPTIRNYRKDPDRFLKPLCVVVADRVLGDTLRWEEVKGEVEQQLA